MSNEMIFFAHDLSHCHDHESMKNGCAVLRANFSSGILVFDGQNTLSWTKQCLRILSNGKRNFKILTEKYSYVPGLQLFKILFH